MIVELFDYLGNKIGESTLPDEASAEQVAALQARYAAPPAPPPEPRVTSFAVDKAEVDQTLVGTDWTKLTAGRMLWDVESGFVLEDSIFEIKKTGIYNYDFQMRLKNLVNVRGAEVALWQFIDGVEDDYWFTLKREIFSDLDNVMQLGGMTQFDFFKDEKYYLAVRLLPMDPETECSAEVSGSDDYTAWGASFSTPLERSYRE